MGITRSIGGVMMGIAGSVVSDAGHDATAISMHVTNVWSSFFGYLYEYSTVPRCAFD